MVAFQGMVLSNHAEQATKHLSDKQALNILIATLAVQSKRAPSLNRGWRGRKPAANATSLARAFRLLLGGEKKLHVHADAMLGIHCASQEQLFWKNNFQTLRTLGENTQSSKVLVTISASFQLVYARPLATKIEPAQ